MKTTISKYQVATAVAILFHVIGLIGILFFDKTFFINATWVNLLLMFALLVFTQQNPGKQFIILLVICVGTGIMVEIVGTHTGLLFGEYKYGNVLGLAIQRVPLIIGINWFIIIYCCGISIHMMLTNIIAKLAQAPGGTKPVLKAISMVIDGACLAVFFDWLMEPVAVKLGYWQWLPGGEIPLYNYVCWFIISSLLLIVFHFTQFNKHNKFAVNLLLIQAMFFLLLRTFL
ncbi:MAG: carotenoid biosynthesis protein [Ferruginibacter sp.]